MSTLRSLLIVLAFTLSTLAVAADKPDVVIILCDDFNPYYTGIAGDPDAQTPNIDALAEESAVFTNCYAASPVCMPSRTCLITGLYPHNTGCWGNASDLFVSPQLTSMFSDFKGAGYTTAMFGKTHWFSGPGFKEQFESKKDYFHGIGIDAFEEVTTTFGSRTGSGVYQDYLKEIGKFEAQAMDLTDRLRHDQYVARPSILEPEETTDWMVADFALEYIEQAPRDEPFAMMIGFSNPHTPMDPSGKYATMYDPEALTLRENVGTFEKYGTDYTMAQIRRTRAAYLGKISFLDDLTARVIEGLKARGNWENTILVFTADHGLMIGEQSALSKGRFYEESAKLPMVMRIPGVTDEGMRTAALAQLIDLYPTLIDAVGGEVSPHVLGKSQMPVIRGEKPTVRDAAFTEIYNKDYLNYMVREERFKWFTERGDTYLFDLETDPFEQTNLADDPEHAEIAAAMKDRLRRFLMTEQVNYSAGYVLLANREKAAAAKEKKEDAED